jgi:hypothetical protein
MKKIVKTLEDFSIFLYNLGKIGSHEDSVLHIENSNNIPKKYINILKQCNIDCSKNNTHISFQSKKYPEIFYCWKWLSTSPNHSFPHFIGCMFDKDYPYTSKIYEKLSKDKKSFQTLLSFLMENNYLRIDNRDNKVNLDYAKEYDKKENKLKEAWGERTHGGFSVQYDVLMQSPLLYSLRVPYYKILLEHSEKMSDEVNEFIVNTGKKCDNCRYCVQMDKTGKKALSYITVVNNNKKFNMCTYFPGFNYCWENLNEKIVNNIKCFLIFADNVLKNI